MIRPRRRERPGSGEGEVGVGRWPDGESVASKGWLCRILGAVQASHGQAASSRGVQIQERTYLY